MTTDTTEDLDNIEHLPSGSWRVRVAYCGQTATKTFGPGSLDAARRWRDAVKLELAEGNLEAVTGLTMKQLGPKFLGARRGNRDPDTDESRWYQHVATAHWAQRPAIAVTRADGLAWLEELATKRTNYDPKKHGKRTPKKLAWDTRRKVLNLARCAFKWAMDQGLVPLASNPFADLRVERQDGDEDEGYQEGWYLDATEQKWLLSLYDTLICFDHVERMEKWIVQFVMSTGLRLQETWCLHLADVHVDGDDPHVVVRFGSFDPVKDRYRPPKGRKGERKPRKVPLWGPSLEAAKRWLEVRAEYIDTATLTAKRSQEGSKHSPLDLMFPTQRGARRDAKGPRTFRKLVPIFGILPRLGRSIWWHLLRHTCASSLISGWWGMRWSIEDVSKVLGHSDIKVTQRYAHLAPTVVLETAARAHVAYAASKLSSSQKIATPPRFVAASARNDGRVRQDSNLRPTAPEAQRIARNSGGSEVAWKSRGSTKVARRPAPAIEEELLGRLGEEVSALIDKLVRERLGRRW